MIMSMREEAKIEQSFDLKLLGQLMRYSKKMIPIILFCVVLLVISVTADLLRPRILSTIIDGFLSPETVYVTETAAGELKISDEPTDIVIEDGQVIRANASAPLTPTQRSGLNEQRYQVIVKYALFLFTLVLLTMIANASQQYLLNYVGQKVIFTIRSDLFEKLESLPLSFHEHNPVGRLVTRMTNDLNNISELYTSVIVTGLSDIAIIGGSIAMMMSMNARLALVALGVAPFLIIATMIFRRLVREAYRNVRVKLAKINATLSENITGMKTIQIFNQEDKFIDNFRKINDEYKKASLREMRIYAIFRPLVNLIYYTSLISALVYGGFALVRGEIAVGVIVAFTLYIKQLFQPVMELAEKFNIFQSSMASIERIFLLMEEPDTILNPDSPYYPEALKGEVEFRNVSFHYQEDEPILKNISFKASPGQTIALVGATGSGKSTIMSLLTRLYDTIEGDILFDGVSMRDYDKEFIRKKIAPVLQDVFLFSGTIRDNIRLLNKDISDEEIWKAAEFVNAHHFIGKLHRGLDHRVTEGGTTLSAGERQLLSFARALVHDPDILILDEATASIDTQTEMYIQEATKKITQGRTTFVVAHRLSTIVSADQILVLHKGRIVERGNHQSLLAQEGLYYDLYRLQFEQREEVDL